MMRGRRVVVLEGGRIELEPFDVPEPRTGQVLLRALRTLISPGTERAWLLGLPNTSPSFPAYPGYSMVGEVLACGAGVADLRAGDRVVCPAHHMSHDVVAADVCVKAPDNVPDEDAVFFNLMGIAMQGLRKARIELGESAAVLGAGIIGILSMRLAQLSGALPVIGIARRQAPLELAMRVGVDEVIVSDAALDENLRGCLGGRGADVVIECTGAPSLAATAFQLAAHRGRVVLVGSSRGDAESVNFYRDVHLKGIQIIGGHISARPTVDSSPGYWTERREHALCLDLMSRGRVNVSPLITHRYDWRDFPKAYELLANWDKSAVGIVIRWADR